MLARGLAGVVVLATLMVPGAGSAQPAAGDPTPTHARQSRAAQDKARNALAEQQDGKGGCIYINQLQGDHALNDHAVIFRANVSDFYQLDFAQQCTELNYPQPILVLTPFGGNGLVCRALDLDVKVREQGPGSISEPCIPSAFHKMTPAEVAAVPKKDLP